MEVCRLETVVGASLRGRPSFDPAQPQSQRRGAHGGTPLQLTGMRKFDYGVSRSVPGGGRTGFLREVTIDATRKIAIVRISEMITVSAAWSFRRRAVWR